MRVWDIPVNKLCDKHLIAQHHEIHCIYSIIVNGKNGFAHHPEVMRWRDNLASLRNKHDITVIEMLNRHKVHKSPLVWFENYLPLNTPMPKPWQPVEVQIALLKSKGCSCNVRNK
jgi:hypothetical protein